MEKESSSRLSLDEEADGSAGKLSREVDLNSSDISDMLSLGEGGRSWRGCDMQPRSS